MSQAGSGGFIQLETTTAAVAQAARKGPEVED